MNSVSWFLYATDVIGNLRGVALIAACVFGVIFLGTLACVPISEGDCLDIDNRTTWFKFFWRSLSVALIALTISVFFPSKDTMYAIAASQVGEKVIQNEAVQGIATDATKALQQWIKRQITDDKK